MPSVLLDTHILIWWQFESSRLSRAQSQVLPITAKIAAESVRLGDEFPRDPADQIIAATARCHGLTLMTSDKRIRNWGRVPVV
jgi:PIN domain nuclease of toxin-antitoxin system